MSKYRVILLSLAVVTVLLAAAWFSSGAASTGGEKRDSSAFVPNEGSSEKADPAINTVAAEKAESAEQDMPPVATVLAEPTSETTEQPVAEQGFEESHAAAQEEIPVEKTEIDIIDVEDAGVEEIVVAGAAAEAAPEPTPSAPVENKEPTPTAEAEDCFTVSLAVRCDTVLLHMDQLAAEKQSLVPDNGVLFYNAQAIAYPGENVFNVLQREMKQGGVHLEFTQTPLYNSAYIEGINNLYEFDLGELSGWLYKVNGEFPNYGCSRYKIQDGDIIEWLYTCDLGYDIGGHLAREGQRS